MTDLPTGVVTFLFTDIEGSTRLARQLRDRYGDLLAEHQRLLRGAFSKHNGHEIDTQGDAFFRVRIGIHSARATPVDGREGLVESSCQAPFASTRLARGRVVRPANRPLTGSALKALEFC
jgi:hypothetical protein